MKKGLFRKTLSIRLCLHDVIGSALDCVVLAERLQFLLFAVAQFINGSQAFLTVAAIESKVLRIGRPKHGHVLTADVAIINQA